jgi:hypothetical protein
VSEPQVVVLFRRGVRKGDTDVFALFPQLPADNEGDLCTCYQHIGGHGAASYHGCMGSSRPAREDEYADLLRELRRIGYNLIIRTRATARMHDARRAEAKNVTESVCAGLVCKN